MCEYCARSDKKFGKRDSVANCQPKFSDFLRFSNLAILSHFGEWNHNPNRHVLFLEKFQQTKIGDLGALQEICKSGSTEILSYREITYLKICFNILG